MNQFVLFVSVDLFGMRSNVLKTVGWRQICIKLWIICLEATRCIGKQQHIGSDCDCDCVADWHIVWHGETNKCVAAAEAAAATVPMTTPSAMLVAKRQMSATPAATSTTEKPSISAVLSLPPWLQAANSQQPTSVCVCVCVFFLLPSDTLLWGMQFWVSCCRRRNGN